MAIAGPAILRLNNGTPIGLEGEWNVSRSIPVFRSYGQGNGQPGTGYNGSKKGTAQSVSGSFRFVVDPTGVVTQAQLYALQESAEFFTMDWPLGDPLTAAVKAKAIDCHWDSLSISVDAPNGKMEITGNMTAGKLEFTEGAI